MRIGRRSARVVLGLALGSMAVMGGPAGAQREAPDLKALAPGQQVSSVRYCRGVYEVALKDGSVRAFKEFDPALVPTGQVGDRAFVVFAGLDELKAWLKKC